MQQVQEAVQLVVGAFGPWTAHHIVPAALQAGLGLLSDVLPAALGTLLVRLCLWAALLLGFERRQRL